MEHAHLAAIAHRSLDGELACDESEEIRRQRPGLAESHAHAIRALLAAGLRRVRDRLPPARDIERQRVARLDVRLIEAGKGQMSARRDKKCVEEIVVAVQRLVSRGKFDGNAVLTGAGCVSGDNEVVLDVDRNNRGLPDADAADPLFWCRKINDDAPRRRKGDRKAQNALDRLLPVYWHRKRQVVTHR